MSASLASLSFLNLDPNSFYDLLTTTGPLGPKIVDEKIKKLNLEDLYFNYFQIEGTEQTRIYQALEMLAEDRISLVNEMSKLSFKISLPELFTISTIYNHQKYLEAKSYISFAKALLKQSQNPALNNLRIIINDKTLSIKEKYQIIKEWLNDDSNSFAIHSFTELSLDSLDLTTLPEEITKFTNITFLGLSNNHLTVLPQDFTFPLLETLMIQCNKLVKLPNLHLPSLKKLYLTQNNLTSIESLDLPSLKLLHLNFNYLSSLSGKLKLPDLEDLYLEKNKISLIEDSINLPSLKRLYLSNNLLTTLPKSLSLSFKEIIIRIFRSEPIPFSNLELLFLEKNLFVTPPRIQYLPKIKKITY